MLRSDASAAVARLGVDDVAWPRKTLSDDEMPVRFHASAAVPAMMIWRERSVSVLQKNRVYENISMNREFTLGPC